MFPCAVALGLTALMRSPQGLLAYISLASCSATYGLILIDFVCMLHWQAVLAIIGQIARHDRGEAPESEPPKQPARTPSWWDAIEGLLVLHSDIRGKSLLQGGSPRGVCEPKGGAPERCFMAGLSKRAPVAQKGGMMDAQTDNEYDEGQNPFSKLTKLGWWW